MWNGEDEDEVSYSSSDALRSFISSSDTDYLPQRHETPIRRPRLSKLAAASPASRLAADFDKDIDALQKLARTPSRTKNGNFRKAYNNSSRSAKAKGGRTSPQRVLARLALQTQKRVADAMRRLPQCNCKCCPQPNEEEYVYDKVRAYLHLKVHTGRESAQRDYLVASFRAVPPNGKFTSSVPNKIPLCGKCFCLYNGITERTFQRMRPKAETTHAAFERKQMLSRTSHYLPTLKAWMEKYAEEGAEWMPNKNIIYLNDATWFAVFNKMQEQNLNLATMGFSTFNALRFKHLGNIKLRSKTDFATCDYCNELQECIARSLGPQKDVFKKELRLHDEGQRRERGKKDKQIQKAMDKNRIYHGKSCAVIEIDGMDKSKTQLGRRAWETKSSEPTEKMGAHVTGAQVHFNGEMKTYGYVSLERYPVATDHVLTVLLDALVRSGISAEGSTVDTLYIWLDNCSRENKSRFTLAVMQCLIQRGCFMKIVVNYLPIGHTHDKVDQVFSRVSVNLKQRNTMTVHDLCAALTEGFKGLEPVQLTHIGAYTARTHYCASNDVDGITFARSFRFMRDEEGKVRHHFRTCCQSTKKNSEDPEDDNWMPYNADALAMFPNDVFPDLTRVLQLSPTPVKTLQLRATADLFLDKGYMTEEQCQWWHDQLDVFTEQDKEVCEECVRLRMVMKGNPKLMKDSKAEKKRKGRNYRKAYFGLFKHLQDETGHKLFQSMLPFPAVLWNYDADEGYSCVAGPPVELPPLSHIDTQLLREVRDQRVEGVAAHGVGQSKTSQIAKRHELDKALNDILVGDFCIVSTGGAGPPWYVAQIEELEFANAGAEDAEGPKTVHRVKLREMGNAGNDVLGTHKYKYTNPQFLDNSRRGPIAQRFASKDQYNNFKAGTRHSKGFKLAEAHWEFAHCLAAWKTFKENLLTTTWKVKADVLKEIAMNPRIKAHWQYKAATDGKHKNKAAPADEAAAGKPREKQSEAIRKKTVVEDDSN